MSSHAAKAIQKNTSETVVSHRQPVSTAVAIRGRRVHPQREHRRPPSSRARATPRRRRRPAAGSTPLATIHVTTVTGRTLHEPGLDKCDRPPASRSPHRPSESRCRAAHSSGSRRTRATSPPQHQPRHHAVQADRRCAMAQIATARDTIFRSADHDRQPGRRDARQFPAARARSAQARSTDTRHHRSKRHRAPAKPTLQRHPGDTERHNPVLSRRATTTAHAAT